MPDPSGILSKNKSEDLTITRNIYNENTPDVTFTLFKHCLTLWYMMSTTMDRSSTAF